MRGIVILFALFAATSAVSIIQVLKEEWHAFKLQHRKNYETDVDEKYRMKIFLENKKKIATHNQKFEQGLVSYKLGLNKYSDLLSHEFVGTLNGFNRSATARTDWRKEAITFMSPANVEIPNSVDWRVKGSVTPIKDQGHCGSCWAFSSTGALEGQHFRKAGILLSLSEQNLVDCSSSYGNNGCNGGIMDNAFRYIKDNGGVDTEKSYPYEGLDDTCNFKPNNVGATDKGFSDIPAGDEKKLKEAVATVGPVSVAIDASHPSFQLYAGGVYFDPQCDSETLDHGVLVVGYGTDETGGDFWLVKNSWGTTWGEDGYIKMARNKKNHCGIATIASYPLV